MREKFRVEFLEQANDFLDSLSEKAKSKILYNYNIKKSALSNDSELLKKLSDEIWEFRTLYNGQTYRLLAFWDKQDPQDTLVIIVNGFIKKTKKTPFVELERARQLKRKYFGNE